MREILKSTTLRVATAVVLLCAAAIYAYPDVGGVVSFFVGSTVTPVSSSNPLPVTVTSGGGGGSVTQGTSPWVDNITQWASGVLGAMANYGTSPGPVLVPGVNAFVTNNPAPMQATGGTVGISGPLGATQASPATPVSVVEPDEFAISGSVSSAATLFTQDMLGYQSITVQINANAAGNTITFETSDDNTNWNATTGLISNAVGASAGTSTSVSSVGLYQFSKKGRYFRARVSTFISGTTTVVGNLHKDPASGVVSSVGILGSIGLGPSSNAVGKFGPGYTSAQTPITAASGNVAAGVATATLAAAGGKLTYITGFEITSDGATVGVCVNPTVVGVVTGTMTYTYCAPAGALLAATPLIVEFPQPIPSSAVNTAVAVSLPSLGTGSTNATVTAHGYQE